MNLSEFLLYLGKVSFDTWGYFHKFKPRAGQSRCSCSLSTSTFYQNKQKLSSCTCQQHVFCHCCQVAELSASAFIAVAVYLCINQLTNSLNRLEDFYPGPGKSRFVGSAWCLLTDFSPVHIY